MKHRGFTLTELLIALAIIGGIAALTIPSLMSSINEKIFNTKFENLKLQVQQLATDQLLQNKTKTIAETDFAVSETLLSEANFGTSEKCSDCWSADYYKLEEAKNNANAHNKKEISINATGTSVILKNGVLITYNYDDEKGQFLVDLNGNEAPNIINKDIRSFTVEKNGQINSSDINAYVTEK